MKRRTYDQIQIEAKLIRCVKCKLRWYMTHRRRICIACRQHRPVRITVGAVR